MPLSVLHCAPGCCLCAGCVPTASCLGRTTHYPAAIQAEEILETSSAIIWLLWPVTMWMWTQGVIWDLVQTCWLSRWARALALAASAQGVHALHNTCYEGQLAPSERHQCKNTESDTRCSPTCGKINSRHF